jgi:hypothetical protein
MGTSRAYLPLFVRHQFIVRFSTYSFSTYSQYSSNQFMALLSSIFGFSLFGLGARMGQLGIQKRNLLESAHPPAGARRADFC